MQKTNNKCWFTARPVSHNYWPFFKSCCTSIFNVKLLQFSVFTVMTILVTGVLYPLTLKSVCFVCNQNYQPFFWGGECMHLKAICLRNSKWYGILVGQVAF